MGIAPTERLKLRRTDGGSSSSSRKEGVGSVRLSLLLEERRSPYHGHAELGQQESGLENGLQSKQKLG